MRNNPSPPISKFKNTKVIYQYTCPLEDCKLPESYIGMTETKLTRRLSYHLNNGGPAWHTENKHGRRITRKMLEEGTEILDRESDRKRLLILESIYITFLQPTINKQVHSAVYLPTSSHKNA